MNYKRLQSTLLFIFTFCFTLLSFGSVTHAEKVELAGWGWSSNIGWVSLSCVNINDCATSDYRVSLNPISTNILGFSGWGWSSNVGWVKFAGDSSHPSPVVDTSTGRVSGFIRVCSGTINKDCASADRSDGWDGWIQLSDSNFYKSPDFTGNGGVTLDIKDKRNFFKGYSWGSEVVGWFKFDPSLASTDTHCVVTCTTTPVVEIKASCTVPSSVILVAGQARVTPQVTVTGGTPPYFWSPLSFDFTKVGTYPITVNVSDSNTTSKNEIPVFCGNVEVVNQGTPTVTIKANPMIVDPTVGITDVSWTPVNAVDCTALGDWNVPGSKSGTSVEHTERQTNVIKIKNYKIFCTNAFGVSPTAAVTVGILGGPTPPPVNFDASCPYDQNIVMPIGSSQYTAKPYTNSSAYSTGNIGTVSVDPGSITFFSTDVGHTVTKYVDVTDTGSNLTIKTKCDFRVSLSNSNLIGLPTVYLIAQTNPVDSGASPYLIWTTKNADSCVATNMTNSSDNIWNGSKINTDGDHQETQSNITTETTYSIKCSNTNGDASASVTVGVKDGGGSGGGCTGPSCPVENGNVQEIALYIGSPANTETTNTSFKVKKPGKFLLRWFSSNLSGYSCKAITLDSNNIQYDKFGDWNDSGSVNGNSIVSTNNVNLGSYSFKLSCTRVGYSDKISNPVTLKVVDTSVIEEK